MSLGKLHHLGNGIISEELSEISKFVELIKFQSTKRHLLFKYLDNEIDNMNDEERELLLIFLTNLKLSESQKDILVKQGVELSNRNQCPNILAYTNQIITELEKQNVLDDELSLVELIKFNIDETYLYRLSSDIAGLRDAYGFDYSKLTTSIELSERAASVEIKYKSYDIEKYIVELSRRSNIPEDKLFTIELISHYRSGTLSEIVEGTWIVDGYKTLAEKLEDYYNAVEMFLNVVVKILSKHVNVREESYLLYLYDNLDDVKDSSIIKRKDYGLDHEIILIKDPRSIGMLFVDKSIDLKDCMIAHNDNSQIIPISRHYFKSDFDLVYEALDLAREYEEENDCIVDFRHIVNLVEKF